MKRPSRFDVPPGLDDSSSNDRLKTLSQDVKRKRCEATTTFQSDQTTLWMGDLERWEDEAHLSQFLNHLLPETCSLINVKIVRDNITNYHLGYGFLDFGTHQAAEEALEILRRTCRPGHNRRFKISWAASNTHKPSRATNTTNNYSRTESLSRHHRSNDSEDEGLTLHIGSLDHDVTENELSELLSMAGYVSIMYVKISRTEFGNSRGFGFVRFLCPLEFHDARQRLHGTILRQKPIQISVAHRSGRVVDHSCQSFWNYQQSSLTPTWNLWSGWPTFIPYAAESYDTTITSSPTLPSSFTGHFSAEPTKQQGSSYSEYIKPCLACCGDCPLSCIEKGFEAYNENSICGCDDESEYEATFRSPISVRFESLDILADAFQYIFA